MKDAFDEWFNQRFPKEIFVDMDQYPELLASIVGMARETWQVSWQKAYEEGRVKGMATRASRKVKAINK